MKLIKVTTRPKKTRPRKALYPREALIISLGPVMRLPRKDS